MKNRKPQAQEQYIAFVRESVLKFYISNYEVFKTLPEEILFFKALKVQPVTKKAICKAFDLNIEAMCRLKRRLEKNGKLKQSKKKVVCQFTRYMIGAIFLKRLDVTILRKIFVFAILLVAINMIYNGIMGKF